jgi:hypothetical protein
MYRIGTRGVIVLLMHVCWCTTSAWAGIIPATGEDPTWAQLVWRLTDSSEPAQAAYYCPIESFSVVHWQAAAAGALPDDWAITPRDVNDLPPQSSDYDHQQGTGSTVENHSSTSLLCVLSQSPLSLRQTQHPSPLFSRLELPIGFRLENLRPPQMYVA